MNHNVFKVNEIKYETYTTFSNICAKFNEDYFLNWNHNKEKTSLKSMKIMKSKINYNNIQSIWITESNKICGFIERIINII